MLSPRLIPKSNFYLDVVYFCCNAYSFQTQFLKVGLAVNAYVCSSVNLGVLKKTREAVGTFVLLFAVLQSRPKDLCVLGKHYHWAKNQPFRTSHYRKSLSFIGRWSFRGWEDLSRMCEKMPARDHRVLKWKTETQATLWYLRSQVIQISTQLNMAVKHGSR